MQEDQYDDGVGVGAGAGAGSLSPPRSAGDTIYPSWLCPFPALPAYPSHQAVERGAPGLGAPGRCHLPCRPNHGSSLCGRHTSWKQKCRIAPSLLLGNQSQAHLQQKGASMPLPHIVPPGRVALRCRGPGMPPRRGGGRLERILHVGPRTVLGATVGRAPDPTSHSCSPSHQQHACLQAGSVIGLASYSELALNCRTRVRAPLAQGVTQPSSLEGIHGESQRWAGAYPTYSQPVTDRE